eukprot:m.310601 g.310601  ORF g.310601 m.310601 type:complete len:506 (+) comp53006_c0_seq1:50-1567(+)
MSVDRYSKLQGRYDSLTARLLGSGDNMNPNASNRLKKRPKSTLEIRSRAAEVVEDHDKRLKLINEHMWQHRQEGRELRRVEMDITRTQRNLTNALQSKEREVAKKRAAEEKRLQEKQLSWQRHEHQDLHVSADFTRNKVKSLSLTHAKNNEAVKRHVKAKNETEFVYEKLCYAVDRKRAEVQKLSEEFEQKIRRKEEEQFLLQKRLTEMAITLNMEAHKRRKEEANEMSQRAKEIMKEAKEKKGREESLSEERWKAEMAGRQFEERKKDLAKSLRQEKDRLEFKGRETGRRLGGVKKMLAQNADMQTFSVSASEHVEGAKLLTEMEEKMRRVEEKRKAQIKVKMMETMRKNGKDFEEWERRISKQQSDLTRKQHEDRMRDLMKEVHKQDNAERKLYDKARSSEEERRKRDQVVGKLQEELDACKRENARKLKELAVSTQKVEEEIKQKIIREAAELSKALNEKQESLRLLAQARYRSQEERYMLDEEKREHERLLRIEQRTNSSP